MAPPDGIEVAFRPLTQRRKTIAVTTVSTEEQVPLNELYGPAPFQNPADVVSGHSLEAVLSRASSRWTGLTNLGDSCHVPTFAKFLAEYLFITYLRISVI